MEIQQLLQLLDSVRKVGHNKWMALCPAHADTNPSLCITSDHRGIGLYCHAGCETEKICQALGISLRDLFKGNNRKGIYEMLPPGIAQKWYGKKLVRFWRYLDKSEKIVGYVVRYEDSGGKEIIPYFKRRGGKWKPGALKDNRPLYNLHEILKNPEAKIIFCEGEKAADAAQKLLRNRGFIGTTTQGGAKAPKKTDFSPLAGRTVWVWPDADQAGLEYSRKVAALAKKGGAKEIHIIDPVKLGFEMGSKKDAADWDPKKPLPDLLPEMDDGSPRLVLTPLSDIEPEEVSWLWEPYLPQGKLTLIEGDPGTGKTWVSLAICARLTSEGQQVIYASCEDGIADTLRPRVDGMSGDLSKFFILRGLQIDGRLESFDLGQLLYLREAIDKVKPSLVVLDPVQGFLGCDVDMHKANEVRSRLAGVIGLADEFGCSVLLVRHLNKTNSFKGIYRGLGSIDFSAAARSIILVGMKDKQRALIHMKNSLGPIGPSLGFEIKEGRFLWKGEVDITESDILGEPDKPEKRSALKEAIEFLEEVLEGGPVSKREIDKQARACGISDITLRRAKSELNIKVLRERNSKGKVVAWLWSLPDVQAQEKPDVQALKDTFGHLDKFPQNRMDSISNPDGQEKNVGHLDMNVEKSNTYGQKNQVAKLVSYRDGHLDMNNVGGSKTRACDFGAEPGNKPCAEKNKPGDHSLRVQNEHLDESSQNRMNSTCNPDAHNNSDEHLDKTRMDSMFTADTSRCSFVDLRGESNQVIKNDHLDSRCSAKANEPKAPDKKSSSPQKASSSGARKLSSPKATSSSSGAQRPKTSGAREGSSQAHKSKSNELARNGLVEPGWLGLAMEAEVKPDRFDELAAGEEADWLKLAMRDKSGEGKGPTKRYKKQLLEI